MTDTAYSHISASASAGLGVGQPVVRPISGLKAKGIQVILDHINAVLTPVRDLLPILVLGRTALVTRYDDVKEVFLGDDVFGVPYAEKLNVITGGMPFLLGMEDSALYRHNRDALRSVIRPEDVEQRLVPATQAAAEHLLTTVDGCMEVTDYFRRVTFEVLLDYFGAPAPAQGDIAVWSTRLFEYIFHIGEDAALEKEARAYAAALLAHLDEIIRARKSNGEDKDDVLGRCLKKQALGEPGFSDGEIRAALAGLIVAGLPQPAMVLPKVIEQLLRRSKILAETQALARNGDEARFSDYIFEAMRFDPLAPFLRRTANKDHVLAAGTRRAKTIPRGTDVFFFFGSAMMDGRQVPSPRTFNPDRAPNNYILFGHGLHRCFGIHINKRLLPLILMPLLRRTGLRRASGAEGHLRKQTVFPDRLVVCFDEGAASLS